MSGADTLAQLVAQQRWFGSKSRELAGGSVIDYGDLEPGFALALYEVRFAEGDTELYQLPMRLVGVSDFEISLADPELGRALLAAMLRGQPLRLTEGTVDFVLSGPFALGPDVAPVRAVGGEQSNSSIVFGERVILKAYRRLEGGESPELELLRFLATHGFEHMPPLLGWYRYAGPRMTATLGILQVFAVGARDGWELALESFADPAAFFPQLRQLGEVTARMHAVLACDAADAAFRPEPFGAEAAERSAADARVMLAGLEPGGPGEPVRARTGEVLERLRALQRAGSGGQAIRQHGDYHLGQVLRTEADWLVLDFEGEPARPLAERRRKTTPLRDVAGMLRSFAYAAETIRSRGEEAGDWERDARDAFLAGYESAIDQSLLPAPGAARAALLAACELEKALYELRYELNNRPDWVHVPLAGILRLLDDVT